MAATRSGSTPQLLAQDRGDLVAQHDGAADPLVGNHRVAQLLDGMREGIMPDIVQQRGGADSAGILVGDPVRVGTRAQMLDRLPGKMEDADRMLEAGVPRAGPDAGDESKLLNALQAQKCLRIDQPKLGVGQRHDVVEAVAQHGGHRKSGAGRATEPRFWMRGAMSSPTW